MFPAFYQTTLRAHLSEAQYLTLQLLLLLQAYRQVKLSVLASVFPQPIQYQSRKRNLQRFLVLPKLTLKVLWFPLLKYWIRQVQTGRGLNRDQRRRLRTLKHHKHDYWILAIDRTEWKGRNIFMVSVVWGTHALPVYWELLGKGGNSDLTAKSHQLRQVMSTPSVDPDPLRSTPSQGEGTSDGPTPPRRATADGEISRDDPTL